MAPEDSEETGHPGATGAEAAGDIRARMRRGLVAAMKARDQRAVAALRSALARIDNAEAVDLDAFDDEGLDDEGLDDEPAPSIGTRHPTVAGSVVGVGAADVDRRILTPEQMAKIVSNEVIEREAAADVVERVGHPEQAERLRAQAELLTTYLDPPGPPRPGPSGGSQSVG
jgi:uncharacterized protein YqeY